MAHCGDQEKMKYQGLKANGFYTQQGNQSGYCGKAVHPSQGSPEQTRLLCLCPSVLVSIRHIHQKAGHVQFHFLKILGFVPDKQIMDLPFLAGRTQHSGEDQGGDGNSEPQVSRPIGQVCHVREGVRVHLMSAWPATVPSCLAKHLSRCCCEGIF